MSNKHYVKLDVNDNIVKGFSDAFERPQSGDICIAEVAGRHFELFGNVNPRLIDEYDVWLYRYQNGTIIHKSPDVIVAERPILEENPIISEIDQIRLALAELAELIGGE